MARPRKEGMEYFPHDVNASNDEKIEALRGEYGNDGYAFYFILLERIYKNKDGELNINKLAIKKAIIKHIGIDEQTFNDMLNFCFEVDLFDKDMFEKEKVLTSCGIKNRCEEVNNMREKWRNKKVIQEENSNINRFSQEKTQQIMPQSKVKESKVNINKSKDKVNINKSKDKVNINKSKDKVNINKSKDKVNININNNNNSTLYKVYEELGFGTINQITMTDIDVLIEEYTSVWVLDAFREANKQGIRNLKYVEGILSNWRTKGKDNNSIKSEDEKKKEILKEMGI